MLFIQPTEQMDAVSKETRVQREQKHKACLISSKQRMRFRRCKHMHTFVADIRLKVNCCP